MRYNIKKRNSTKAERKVYEVLKKLHIPFRHRWLIKDREVDFVIGDKVIEIDGHTQDSTKNEMLIKNGYTPIHLSNEQIYSSELLEEFIKNLYGDKSI